MRHLVVASLLACPAVAQLQDVGFDDRTPIADPDLVVVRERSYGAAGIDLSPYGVNGVQDFVQSIYVRFAHDSATNANRTIGGHIRFPAGMTAVAVITGMTEMGGSTDDGVLTASDADFGLPGVNPDLYSRPVRGVEGFGFTEHACLRPDGSVDFFLMSRLNDLDDFRVIVDYGSSFPSGQSFDVELTVFDGATIIDRDQGTRVGDGGGAVLGSGDAGEVGGLADIPLTAAVGPTTLPAQDPDINGMVLMTRGTGTVFASSFSAFDPATHTLHTLASPFNSLQPTRGPRGYVYGVQGNLMGFSINDLTSGNVALVQVSGMTEFMTSIYGYESSDVLTMAGHINGVNSDVRVYRVSASMESVTGSWSIGQADLGGQRDHLHIGNDVHVISASGQYAVLDMQTGSYVSSILGGVGSYEAMEVNAAGTKIYTIRNDQATNDCIVDEIDVATGNVTLAVVTDQDLVRPRGITRDDSGRIWIIGRGFGQPSAPIAAYDPNTWTRVVFDSCGADSNSTHILASVNPMPIGDRYCNPGVQAFGSAAWIVAFGSTVVGSNDFELGAYDLPPLQFGYFLNGVGPGLVVAPGGSIGNLCLDPSGGIGRHNSHVFNSGSFGAARVPVDLTALPRPVGVAVVQPGDTWYFTCWHRLASGGSNFTDALAVTFQ